MKRVIKQVLICYLALAAIVIPAQLYAISSADELIALGVQPAVAKKLVEIVNTLASPFPNNTFVTFRNAANGANISVLKVDGSDETILNADTGDSVHLQVAASDKFVVSTSLATSSVPLAFGTSGHTVAIQEATAGAKCMGSVTATGTTAVTVSTTCATTGARILLTRSSAPSGTAICWQTNIVNGVSFDVDCSGAETGTFDWFILQEAA